MVPIITILGHFSEGWSQKYPCEVGKCYYPHFYTGNWGTDGSKSKRAYLAEQSLETRSQSLLLLCRGFATESSHSSLHLWSISTHIYFTNLKPSLGSIVRSLCSATFHECCLPPHRWSTVGLTGCLAAWRVAPPPLRCAPITAPAHTSNTNLLFPSGCRDTTASFHQCPEADSGPRVTFLSVLAPKIYCHCLTVFHLFYTLSIQVMLSFSYRDLPSLTAK